MNITKQEKEVLTYALRFFRENIDFDNADDLDMDIHELYNICSILQKKIEYTTAG